MTPRAVPLIRGLSEIVDDYDALLLDQWGVLHGGVEPYPGVLETLAALRRAGKPVAVLSNAPRRSQHAEGRLRRIGVPPGAYDRQLGAERDLPLQDRWLAGSPTQVHPRHAPVARGGDPHLRVPVIAPEHRLEPRRGTHDCQRAPAGTLISAHDNAYPQRTDQVDSN